MAINLWWADLRTQPQKKVSAMYAAEAKRGRAWHFAMTLAADLVDQLKGWAWAFRDKGHQPFSQVIHVGEVADAQPDAVHNAEQLLDLIHPGAMYRQEPTDTAGMRLEPSLIQDETGKSFACFGWTSRLTTTGLW